MRFNEGGRDLVESERVEKRSSTNTACHKAQASQIGLHNPCRMWVPLSHPVMRVWPLNSQSRYLELFCSSQLQGWHGDVAISLSWYHEECAPKCA